MKNLLIYSTKDSAYFAELIGQVLGVGVGEISRSRFDDGELYHRLKLERESDLFNKTVIFVASTNTDKNFDELEKIGYTLADGGVAMIIFVIPFFGYSTMERVVSPGEAVSAKINARRLSNITHSGRNNVFLMLDLHASAILYYFEGGSTRFEISGERVLAEAIAEFKLKKFIFGTADLGKTRWGEVLADNFKTDLVFIRKSRQFEKTKVLDVIGQVQGKTVVIYDDMTRSGGTLINAAKAYLKHGAKEVYAVLSHLALNDQSVIRRLEKSPIKKIIATNSHPMSQDKLVKRSKKIVIKDVSAEFTEAIKKIISS